MTVTAGKMGPWLPALLWAAVIFGLSSIPGSNIPGIPVPSVDKVVHLGVYGIFGALCFRGLRRTTGLGRRGLVLVGTLIALGYGASDEGHQLLVPGRSCDARDLLADVVGGGLGCLAARWLAERGNRA